MENDPDQAKIDELAARIRHAEQGPQSSAALHQAGAVKMGRLGFDFMGAVLGGALGGWLIDHFLPKLAPWAMLVMVFAGFTGGVMTVWRGLSVTNRDETKG